MGVGKRGGQLQYSDLAIETALTLRLIFHLPLRQTEGFLTSIFGMLGLDLSAPDHTTLSRRGQHLDLPLRRAPAGAGLHLIVDSTGLSIVGEGEWAAAKHGALRGRRGWKKLHLGVDRSGVIVARALTEASVDDATTGITLIEATDGALGRVTAAWPSQQPRTESCVAFGNEAAAKRRQGNCRPRTQVNVKVSRRNRSWLDGPTPSPIRGPQHLAPRRWRVAARRFLAVRTVEHAVDGPHAGSKGRPSGYHAALVGSACYQREDFPMTLSEVRLADSTSRS